MATKEEVIRLHKRHPDWTGPEIAEALGCGSGYVRATAQRNGLNIKHSRRYGLPGTGLEALGRAARAAGLTVEDIKSIGRVVRSVA